MPHLLSYYYLLVAGHVSISIASGKSEGDGLSRGEYGEDECTRHTR